MPSCKNRRRAAQRKAAQRKQQQMAIADSPSNTNPTLKEVEGETEKVFNTPETEIPSKESESGSYSIEDVDSHSNGQERLKDFILEVNGDRNVNLDVSKSRWEEFCKIREEFCKDSENFGDRKLNEYAPVIEEESKISEQIVSCDEKQVQVLQGLDEKIYKEECVEVNGNLNSPLEKKPSISFNENSNNVDLEFASKNKDNLISMKTETLENEDMSLKDSKVNEPVHGIEEESKICEEILSDDKKQAQVSSQLNEQIYTKGCVEVNGNLDATIQKKHPVSFNEISNNMALETASKNSFMKTNESVDALKEKLENEDMPLKDSTEAIGVSPSNKSYKEAEIFSFNVERSPRLDESPILVCDAEDIEEITVENSHKKIEEIPSVIESSKDLVNTNQEIQPRADVNLCCAELHKSTENNSKLVKSSDCEEEGSNMLAFDYLDKQKEEVHFVNEKFNKPVNAVGEKTLADMMNIQLDQSADQNARLDENSPLIPEETKHGKNSHESLESLIRATENSYLLSAEEFAESSSSSAQTGNMQKDKVDPKEARRRPSFLKCCGLLEAFTGS